jgi:hypothetical protein
LFARNGTRVITWERAKANRGRTPRSGIAAQDGMRTTTSKRRSGNPRLAPECLRISAQWMCSGSNNFRQRDENNPRLFPVPLSTQLFLPVPHKQIARSGVTPKCAEVFFPLERLVSQLRHNVTLFVHLTKSALGNDRGASPPALFSSASPRAQ